MTGKRAYRSYPRHFKHLPVPDWARVPFSPAGLAPAMIFSIGGAKAIARCEWSLRFPLTAPSDEELRSFVLGFPWRWRGDQIHRYAILARWAFEFCATDESDRKRAAARARRRPDIVLSAQLGGSHPDDEDPVAPPRPTATQAPSDSPSPPIRRFILLNPPPNRAGRVRKPKPAS